VWLLGRFHHACCEGHTYRDKKRQFAHSISKRCHRNRAAYKTSRCEVAGTKCRCPDEFRSLPACEEEMTVAEMVDFPPSSIHCGWGCGWSDPHSFSQGCTTRRWTSRRSWRSHRCCFPVKLNIIPIDPSRKKHSCATLVWLVDFFLIKFAYSRGLNSRHRMFADPLPFLRRELTSPRHPFPCSDWNPIGKPTIGSRGWAWIGLRCCGRVLP